MTTAIELVISDLRGKLNGQLDGIESARTRAAVAFTIASAGVAVFAPHLDQHPGNLALAGAATFVATALACIYVLWPHNLTLWPKGDGWKDWTKKYKKYLDENPTVAERGDESAALLATQMADDMADWYQTNRGVYLRVQFFLAIAFGLAVVELVLWSLALFRPWTS
jgi:hypothetical protein